MALFDDARSAWTDYVPSGRTRIAPATRDGVRWHWAGPSPHLFGKAHSSCLSQVRGWEAYHRSKGWNSIGYNLLVCVHARVIEGRGVDYRGAHSGSTDDNAATYGVQFMVGTGDTVTPAMFDRAIVLERGLWEHSGHTLFSAGHRDAPGASTECPGDQIWKWAHAAHTLTATPTTTSPEEDDVITPADISAIVNGVHEKGVQVGSTMEPLGDAVGRALSQARKAVAQGDALIAKQDALATALGQVLAEVLELPAETGALLEQKLKDAVVSVEVNFPVDEPAPGA